MSNLNLFFLEKKKINKYKNIKNKILVRSKFDKRRQKTPNKKIINISSFTG